MSSNAVSSSRVSAVVGYLIAKGNFQEVSPNLPQRVAVLCEANTANQASLDLTPFSPVSAQEVGQRYGYGSPAYHIARILIPLSGGGLNGIPCVFYPQAAAGGSTAKIMTISPAGVATGNATHTIKVSGRDNVDGQSYSINIVTGDTVNIITDKITTALTNVLGCPATVTDNDYVNTLTAKWTGATSNDLTVSVDTNNTPVGIAYTIATTQAGAGTPTVTTALNLFGADWVTWVVNAYGLNTSVMTELETFNGVPDNVNPTGRFVGTVMKPFVALCGSVSDDPSAITDARLNNVTCSVSPAPNSTGFPFEAAANDCVNRAVVSQNSPEIDVLNLKYSDMPTPTSIGTMASYPSRDAIVKKGCSTVDLIGGQYASKDPVTTYHPVGEIPPQFRYTRDMMLDWNIRYGYYLKEQDFVVGKVLANDNDSVSSQNVIKPKQWKQVLIGYFTELADRGLIVDVDFSVASLSVSIDSANPNRFNTSFNIKRSGVARISATTAVMGFNFGTLNS